MASALETRNLSLSISGNPIFEDISLSLPKGAFAALCGRNGSGKSQLLRCIKGLVRQNAGEIYTDGIKTDPKTRMKKIAIVFQNAEMQIVSQSVEKDVAFGPENMGFDKEEVRRRTSEALRVMGLEAKAKQRPQTLSGGELRKCAIAGILAMEPDVILLDEPFANLDYPSTLTVIKSLITLHEKGYTLLVVSHEAEKFLAHTDALLIMDKGHLVMQGESSRMFNSLSNYDIYLPANACFEDLTWLR